VQQYQAQVWNFISKAGGQMPIETKTTLRYQGGNLIVRFKDKSSVILTDKQ